MDWFGFLRQHNIPYTTVGPNASRGRVQIKCPLCGDADRSEHMGISLAGNGWSCWRNDSHKGKSEARMVQLLLKCGFDEAQKIVGGGVALPQDEDFVSWSRDKLGQSFDGAVQKVTHLELPRQFKPLNNGSLFASPYLKYLRGRGYRATQLSWLAETYNLQYAREGRFRGRLIIPIYDRWGELQTFTGRAISPDAEVRYLTLKNDQQVCSPKETLIGLPLLHRCSNPRVLLVCEGPFDAFWVTAFGRMMGVYATCLFGLSMSDQQAELLSQLKSRFDHVAVLLDSAAKFQSFKMSNSGLNLGSVLLPDDVKDPGELTSAQAVDLCSRILDRTFAA